MIKKVAVFLVFAAFIGWQIFVWGRLLLDVLMHPVRVLEVIVIPSLCLCIVFSVFGWFANRGSRAKRRANGLTPQISRGGKQKSAGAAAKITESRLETLFASGDEELSEGDRLLMNRRAPSRASLYLAATILGYAGQRAARLRNAIKTTKETYTSAPIQERRNMRCDFDPIFVETAALCFWSVMSKYWDGDEGDFWVEDESSDLDYLEELRSTFELADSLITATTTSSLLENYLQAQVGSYMKADPVDSASAMERFAESVSTWTLRREIDHPPDSLTVAVKAFSLKTIADINRPELDALCRLAYARTL